MTFSSHTYTYITECLSVCNKQARYGDCYDCNKLPAVTKCNGSKGGSFSPTRFALPPPLLDYRWEIIEMHVTWRREAWNSSIHSPLLHTYVREHTGPISMIFLFVNTKPVVKFTLNLLWHIA
jgi:hypothetical protein